MIQFILLRIICGSETKYGIIQQRYLYQQYKKYQCRKINEPDTTGSKIA